MQWLICIAWLIVVWVKRIHFIIKNHHLRQCRSHWRLSLHRTTMKSFFPPRNFPEIKIHSLLLWRKYLAFLWHGEEGRRKKRLQAVRKCRSWCWLNKISVSHSCWGRNENENWKEGEKRRIKWRTNIFPLLFLLLIERSMTTDARWLSKKSTSMQMSFPLSPCHFID